MLIVDEFSIFFHVNVVFNKNHRRKVLYISSSLHVLFVADQTFIHSFQFCSTFQTLSDPLHDCNHKSKPVIRLKQFPLADPLSDLCGLTVGCFPSLSHSLA
ncbi:hypothetical protein GOODEAATRI_008740 [Goodea atripinnis]|uniref:Uncharacterized protein n=1 Tax=Goodea atripinnis TaxID=208336 RepID=A0ABV0NCA6_9TELE